MALARLRDSGGRWRGVPPGRAVIPSLTLPLAGGGEVAS